MKPFPSISITGNSCALQCKHCSGKTLSTMIPVTTPEDLIQTCQELKKTGCNSGLISGGCLPDGSLPLQQFLTAISYIRQKYHFKFAVHTGLIRKNLAKKLREAGVDVAMIDVIGSDETIKEVYNLDVTVKEYDESLKALHDSGISFVPHIIIGLHYGQLKGEYNALNMIAKYHPKALVAIVLMPLKDTPMEKVIPPKPEEIARVLATAKIMIPDKPLTLGCMRPKGNHRKKTDVLAIKAGVNAIAFPEKEAIIFARDLDLETEFHSGCCSDIYEICDPPRRS